jgi:hypothetical protein
MPVSIKGIGTKREYILAVKIENSFPNVVGVLCKYLMLSFNSYIA